MIYPSYLQAYKDGKLEKITQEFLGALACCGICPRQCKVNRLKNQKGFCQTGRLAKVCSSLAHLGEEPPISGTRGSGTIFFSHCNMNCVYCQNYEFSQQGQGKELSAQELAQKMLELQASGAHNLNLVTPTHVLPQILEALLIAIPKGLTIPIVYNTGGYELTKIIKLLDGIVDIYLPDSRYGDKAMAEKYSAAPDYPKYNQAAIKEMHRQVGVAKIGKNGIMVKGLVVRHLVLPCGVSGVEKIMRFIAQEVCADTYISLMSQYTPLYKANGFKEICRRVSIEEYRQAQSIMHKYGLFSGWTQDSGGLERFAGTNIKPNI